VVVFNVFKTALNICMASRIMTAPFSFSHGRLLDPHIATNVKVQ
jgi:hypothetical protein